MYKKRGFSRIWQFFQPKLLNEFEELVVPGSYNLGDLYLWLSLNLLDLLCLSLLDISLGGYLRYLFLVGSLWTVKRSEGYVCWNSPGVSFERARHNLKLVDNNEFLGFGQYSLMNAGVLKNINNEKLLDKI